MVNTSWHVRPIALLRSKWHKNVLVQERFPSLSCCTLTEPSSSGAFLSDLYIVSCILWYIPCCIHEAVLLPGHELLVSDDAEHIHLICQDIVLEDKIPRYL
jgi:hypothetical protein